MKKNKITGKRMLIALLGVWLVGIGVGFNNQAGLGNDPVGLFYDGVRKVMGFEPSMLGMVSNGVNTVLAIFLLFTGRKYLNVGTLIYLIPYGLFVNFGTWLYHILIVDPGIGLRVLCSVLGCLFLYFGVAMVITMDIGVDPLVGSVLVLRDITGKEFRMVKIVFDLCLCIIGTLCGGTIGVVTIITAFTAGIGIQFFADRLQMMMKKKENNKKEKGD